MKDRPTSYGDVPAQLLAIDHSIYVDTDQYRSFCEAVVSCVGVGVLVVSPDGTHLLINAEMRQMISVGFAGGHSGAAGQVGEVYEPDGTTRLEAEDLPSARAVRGETFTDLRVVVGPRQGPRLTLSMTARTLLTRSGAVLGTVVVATDITSVSEALEAKDRFLANVSHDLRTPLTSIIGYLAVVLDEPDDLPVATRAHLAVVQRNSERLLGLVNGLLHPATVGTGITLTRSPTDLSRLVELAIELAGPQAEAAGLHLSFSAEPTGPVSLDGGRISEVIDNLISNALKFTPRGGRVGVRLDNDDDEVLLFFSDDGPGVDAADQELIFDRFFRSPGAEENAIPGVGLGLHIAREIIEAHGGRIRVQTSPEGGAEFVVRLPRGSAAGHS